MTSENRAVEKFQKRITLLNTNQLKITVSDSFAASSCEFLDLLRYRLRTVSHRFNSVFSLIIQVLKKVKRCLNSLDRFYGYLKFEFGKHSFWPKPKPS